MLLVSFHKTKLHKLEKARTETDRSKLYKNSETGINQEICNRCISCENSNKVWFFYYAKLQTAILIFRFCFFNCTYFLIQRSKFLAFKYNITWSSSNFNNLNFLNPKTKIGNEKKTCTTLISF